MKKWTKEEIQFQIASDDRWLHRGMNAIHARQTDEERHTGEVNASNGVGFNGVDSPFLSSVITQWNQRGYISARQREMARCRMYKYCGQLAKIANGTII